MLRSIFIGLSSSKIAAAILRPFFKGKASRFTAGDSVESAMDAALKLSNNKIAATIDHLGESNKTQDEVAAACDEYENIIRHIRTHQLDAHVSLKLTQFGLLFDKQLCMNSVKAILMLADPEIIVTIDMESSQKVDDTITMYQILKLRSTNCGICLQAHLKRSAQDLDKLLSSVTEPIIRLVKGAYREEPAIAYQERDEIQNNFKQMIKKILSTPPKQRAILEIATHDEEIINYCLKLMTQLKLKKNSLEFQFLYGVKEDLQTQLAKEGYKVRVYIPYGTDWFPYVMRRIAERPSNLFSKS